MSVNPRVPEPHTSATQSTPHPRIGHHPFPLSPAHLRLLQCQCEAPHLCFFRLSPKPWITFHLRRTGHLTSWVLPPLTLEVFRSAFSSCGGTCRICPSPSPKAPLRGACAVCAGLLLTYPTPLKRLLHKKHAFTTTLFGADIN